MRLMWTSSWPPGGMSIRDMGFMERLTLALTLVINISTDTVETAAPSPPYNVTLNSVTSTTALVHWRSESATSPITHFTMNLVTLDEHQHHLDRSSMAAGYVHDVAIGSARSHLLEHLIPDTLYRMSVVAYCGESFSEASSTVTFRTTTAVPGPPHSLRLSSVSSSDAVIQWQYNVSNPEVSHFDVILVALDHRSHSYGASPVVRYHYGVTGGDVDSVLSHSLDKLIPDTLYRLFMIAANTDGMSNASSVITFRTPAAPLTAGSLQVDPIEILIVSLVVVAWICAIVLFRHKWDKIRIIQPCEPRYRHQPKNLDTIKVVQRPTDSVIYKNYSKTISKNMQARETKRIERMNTMPNIKVSDVIPKSIEPTKQRTIEKRRTVPMIELDMPIDLPTLDRLNEEDSFTENDSTSDARSSVV